MKIVQMMPTDGWRAVFASDQGHPYSEELVMWVLTSDGEVLGFDSTLSPVNRKPNFLGYISSIQSIESYNNTAKTFVRANGIKEFLKSTRGKKAKISK